MDQVLFDTMQKIEQELKQLKDTEKKPVNFIVAVMVDYGNQHDISVRTEVWNDHHYLDLMRSILDSWDQANHVDKQAKAADCCGGHC